MWNVRSPDRTWYHMGMNVECAIATGDSRSGFRDIKIGVPHGSILGPVLFILYINDMCNSSDSLKFIHFADDTTVFLKKRKFRHPV